MEYIKWLSINDLALGIQLKKMDEILKGHIEGNESAGINEIIELFVVCKYMDAQIYPSIWNEILTLWLLEIDLDYRRERE